MSGSFGEHVASCVDASVSSPARESNFKIVSVITANHKIQIDTDNYGLFFFSNRTPRFSKNSLNQ
ncbi:hypothetical protein EDC39_11418 [Geothermobacter ehrlichii]|uniref:Uncharacterized protein n=1 Tax=Geothermobacter ehrlichii TaxID=213224 RepID=A0A5D3WH66_9BACT|nr:hypothetical protein EDC39_11418 [Geothermobacter ehrlichii]